MLVPSAISLLAFFRSSSEVEVDVFERTSKRKLLVAFAFEIVRGCHVRPLFFSIISELATFIVVVF